MNHESNYIFIYKFSPSSFDMTSFECQKMGPIAIDMAQRRTKEAASWDESFSSVGYQLGF